MSININYSQFYKGTEQIKSYGAANGKKDTLVRYEFNTTDEKGNKIMDKMSKEDSFKTMNAIREQYGENVIVEFSGDGLTAFEENKGKMHIPETPAREIPEGMIVELEGPKVLSGDEIKRTPNSKSGDEILADMQKTDSKAFKEYQALREKSQTQGFDPYDNEVIFMARWQMKREFPQLEVWKKMESDNKDTSIDNKPIMTDYNNEFASRMPSIYGDKDKGGNYIRNFISVSDTANNMLKVYASLYDEIVKGYENGTRETYVEDENAEGGYRKLTMEEELDELDKAYKGYVERYEATRDDHVIEILSAHAKKISELSGGRTDIANEADILLEKYKADPVQKEFSSKMMEAARSFVQQYKSSQGIELNSLLSGVNDLFCNK
ncbi:MAG: hypothetical protein IKP88_06710 [Lachnospiraceae bacterium]|nr:hypothetical protein [Lachnospiraceae bacterium]